MSLLGTGIGRGVRIDRPVGRPGDFRTDGRIESGSRRCQQPAMPTPIDGADWQAGVTEGSENFRVLLDGEPVPMAFAASVSGGWVLAFLDAQPIFDDTPRRGPVAYRIPREIADTNPATGNAAGHRTLCGVVKIIADC